MSSPTLRSILEACDRLDCLSLFDEHEIAPEQLPGLTGDDLKEIGIEKLGHRKAILAAIAEAFARPPAEGRETGNEPVLSAPAADAPPDRPKIFLSYGRRDASELAQRLCRDLEAVGFEVWRDVEKLVPGSRWQEEIEEALREAQVVVSLLSPHAVRRGSDSDPTDSVCLDELALARAGRPPTPVVPAMVAACEPPLIIYRLDYVDLLASQQSEDEYRRGFDRLVSGIREALAGKVRYRFWDDRLRPLDFSDYLARKRDGFVGREWLFDEIDLWRYQSAERALLVTGDPGAGKSSIVAQLAHTNPGGQVIAYYFCQSNERETLSPARFVQSVAAMIASRLPAYAEQFEVPAVREALDEQRCERDPGGSFLAGILQPLQKLPDPGEGVRYLLVDALDEALLHGGDTNILDVLAERIERFPSWLRLVATTRNEPSVLQRLSGLRPKRLDAADPRNLADLGAWIRRRLLEPALAEQLVESRAIADRVVEALLEKSTGNFLYAVNALNGIERGFYSFAHLAALPPGLDGLYLDFFRRLFGREGTAEGEAAYARARPLLQVLTAAIEPLSRAELAAASGLDAEEELPRLLRRLAQLHVRRDRPNGEETIAFYHKSIADWLVSNPDGNAFAISPAKGRALLAAFCRAALDTSRAEPCWYVRRHAVAHLLEVGDWDGATAALADLEFIGARAKAQELPAMLLDYAAAGRLLPEGAEERKLADERQAELDRYARDMAEYRAAWSRIRGGSGEQPPALPAPVSQIRPWTAAEIEAERKRIVETPNRLDCVNAFRIFVATNSTALQDHAERKGFVANLAYNEAPAGPVHEAGVRGLAASNGIKLLKRFAPWESYNPLPACLAVLEGHTGEVTSLALSTDGRRVVSGSIDSTLRVWDMEAGACLNVLEGHKGEVTSIVLSADGRRVVSGSADNTLRVWNSKTGACLKVLEGHTGNVTSIALSADGRRVVSGSADSLLRVWDVETGACLKVCEGHTSSVSILVLSADGRLVVSACQNGILQLLILMEKRDAALDFTVRVWDTEAGACLNVLEGHTEEVTSIVLSADGRRVVSGSADNTLRVWNSKTGACLKVLEGHTGNVTSIALSADGRRVVSGSHDNTLRIWDAESGACLKVLAGHTESVRSLALSADERRVVSGSHDNTLRIWDAESGACLKVFEGHTLSVRYLGLSADGRHLVSSGFDNALRIWDIATGRSVKHVERHSGAVKSLVLGTDGRRVVSGGSDSTLRVWDSKTGACLKVLEGHTGEVTSIVLSADGRRVVSGSDDSLLRVWDVETGACLKVLEGHNESVRFLVLSADGRRLVSGGCNPRGRVVTLRFWDVETGSCLRGLSRGMSSPQSMFISADGTCIFSVGAAQTLHVWDIVSDLSDETFERNFNSDHFLEISAMSANGKRLISWNTDKTLRVWNVENGACLKVHEGITRCVEPLVMSEDGKLAVWGHDGNTLRVWNLESGETLAVFLLLGLTRFAIDWSHQRLVAGFADGRVESYQIENLSLGPFITTARREPESEDQSAGPVTARPVCCGQVIEIPPTIAERIEHWHLAGRDRGDDAYNDPALLLECPSCAAPLRLNPFFGDSNLGILLRAFRFSPADDNYIGVNRVYQDLQSKEKALGPEHPDTLSSVRKLANLLNANGDYDGAEPLFRRALEGKEKALGPEHPDTLRSVNHLGILLSDKGDYDGAEPLYRRALEGFEKTLGAEHPDTLKSVHNLGLLLIDKGDHDGAEPLYRRALEGYEKALGPEHPSTLKSVHNLGLLLIDKGDYEGAEALLRRALEGREKALGSEHPETLDSVNNLAFLLNATQRRREAIALLRRFAVLSNDSRLAVAYNLACYECLEGNHEEARLLIAEHLARHPEEKAEALADEDFAAIRDWIAGL